MDKEPSAYVAVAAGFAEYAEVSLARTIEQAGVTMPVGTRGVVMAVWADGLAYEVEFESPRHVLLTVEAADLSG